MSQSVASLAIQRPTMRRRSAALEQAHAFLAPSVRSATVAIVEEMITRGEASPQGLWGAYRGETLVGAVWGEALAGRTAVAHPPQLKTGERRETALALSAALEDYFQSRGVLLYQVQLAQTAAKDRQFLRQLAKAGMFDETLVETIISNGEGNTLTPASLSRDAALMTAAGMEHVGDLLYLACGPSAVPKHAPRGVEFQTYRDSDRRRLGAIIERTYQGSLDLPELDGLRSVDDVIDGYRDTGAYRAGFWRIVRSAGEDIGCLLLTEHPPHRQWEIVYMGLSPESRGNGWGTAIARFAQHLVFRAGGDRLLLAVDARNRPALKTYLRAGFEWWRQRAVFLKSLERKELRISVQQP
ncbi:MAG: GNAT family N-acetyltransferase [Planctomycetes bacterium]|nr:GNAT family N-acetyltransferase [Planctomycetota bacterium]